MKNESHEKERNLLSSLMGVAETARKVVYDKAADFAADPAIGNMVSEFSALSFVAVPPPSATYTANGLVYERRGDTFALIGAQGDITSANLPAELFGFPVTRIEEAALAGCTALTSATIPSGVTSIGQGAFSGCRSLERIVLPFVGESGEGEANAHLGYIFGAGQPSENGAQVPASLKTVIITGGKRIGDNAFHWCSSLISVTLPDSIDSIGSYAFCECSALRSLTIPRGVRRIGYCAFGRCTSLTSVTVPKGVAVIEDYTFERCTALMTARLPQGVTAIGNGAFFGCRSLVELTIPESVTSIAARAFSCCAVLASVRFAAPSGWLYGDAPVRPGLLTDPQTAAKWLAKHCDRAYLRV